LNLKEAQFTQLLIAEFSGITVSHQVFVKPKIAELPAISKQHNVTTSWRRVNKMLINFCTLSK
jgi:hypothetical protein